MTSSCDAESPSGARSDWQLRPGPGTQRNFGLLVSVQSRDGFPSSFPRVHFQKH
ncbi:hypothetical protein ACRRTK_019855 [Alexandromys fortis]